MGADGGAPKAGLHEVLTLVAGLDDVLEPDSFEKLAEVARAQLGCMQLAVVVTDDGDNHFRIHAISRGPATDVVPLRVRMPAVAHIVERVRGERRVYRCDDTSAGAGPELLLAQAGIAAYADLPLVDSADRVVAALVVGFGTKEKLAAVPDDVLEQWGAVMSLGVARAMLGARPRRLAMILDTSGDAMIAWDAERIITDVNGAALQLTGMARGELIGTRVEDLLGPASASITSTPASGWRLKLRTPDGRIRMVSATITRVKGDVTVSAHALLRDLDQVVRAEEEAQQHLQRVRELEGRHRALLDNAPLVIFRLDPKTAELRFLNRYAERLLGIPTREALETPNFLRDVHADPEGATAFQVALERARLAAPSPPHEARLRRRGGDAVAVRGTIYPVLDDVGRVVSVEGVLADVSAEQAALARLVQTDRLSTLGTLAAAVAHEINNPAAFMLLGLDMLAKNLGDSSDGVRTTIEELRDSMKRIVDIARDLRLFAGAPGADEATVAIVDVNRTLESALSLTRGKLIERAEIVRELGEVPPVLMADGRLAQVLVNLLVNAAQAVPKPQAGRPPGEHAVTIKTDTDGHNVQIEVRDSGCGIPQDILSRIWQPFFTTKGPDVGTGLGLAISKSIIERAGGTIFAESPPEGSDRGSRFVIRLPAAGSDVATSQATTTPLPRAPARRGRVLVVEDEIALARALTEQLSQLHDVTVAKNGLEAIERLDEADYGAILCDLRMPGMSGEELYETIERRDTELARRFVFMTGVGFGAEVERFLAGSGRPVLEKPFRLEDALAQIAKVIARP